MPNDLEMEFKKLIMPMCSNEVDDSSDMLKRCDTPTLEHTLADSSYEMDELIDVIQVEPE